jgi:16S rRNA (cytidine1402-2'-O)-methyltransferase
MAAFDKALSGPLAPGLYIVSTPIGNLADISLRALSVLERADMVFCEDTRHTRKLTSHFGISCELEPYHEHNAAKERPRILARIRAGHSVALVADAGTPLISDPGYKLVRAALEEGFAVTSVPGASAALAALTTSGLPSDRFLFAGFLPPRREGRRKALAELADIQSTLVFFEASSRLADMLADAAEVLGAREGAVAKELTKLHEAVVRGPLDSLAREATGSFSSRGEFVVLVGPPVARVVSDAEIKAALEVALDEASLRDAARDIAEQLGVGRKRVYALGLALKEKGAGE